VPDVIAKPNPASRILFDRPGARLNPPAWDHAPGFLNLVNDAKRRVNEVSVAGARGGV